MHPLKRINYLLTRFPKDEWSGPAFYELKKDDKGVPEEWILHGFHPLDLGGGTTTEWEGEDFLKIRKQLLLDNPIFAKCYQGIIHSHHTMGAFLSGTDTGHIEESANLVGYPSLVVASKGIPFACGYSYIDQFKEVHTELVEAKDISLEIPEVIAEREWVKNAEEIEKAKKDKPVAVHNSYFGNRTVNSQAHLWGNGVYQGANEYDYPDERDLKVAKKRLKSARKQLKNKQITQAHFDKINEEYQLIKQSLDDDLMLGYGGGSYV